MRTRSVLVIAALAAACNDDPAGPAARAWNGTCQTAFQFTARPTTSVTMVVTGTCALDGLGTATTQANQTLVVKTVDAAGNPTSLQYDNEATYTFANGDVLRTKNTGVATVIPNGSRLNGTETVIGGTGRFARASGTATITGEAFFTGADANGLPKGTGQLSQAGTLKY